MLYIVFVCLIASINAQVSDDVLCEGRVFEPTCSEGTIRIVSSAYGTTDASFCGGPDTKPWSTKCQTDVSSSVRQACQGKQICAVPVQGDTPGCTGFSKYLRVVWSCDSGLSQSISNNRGSNIVFSLSDSRENPRPLHGQTISGPVFVFLSLPNRVKQVRFYYNDMSKVTATETRAPFDFRGALPLDTTPLPNGRHHIVASITFNAPDETGSTTGYVDAIFNIKNANTGRAAATTKSAELFAETATPAASDSSDVNNPMIPWLLFGSACGLIVILVIVLIVMGNRANKIVEKP